MILSLEPAPQEDFSGESIGRVRVRSGRTRDRVWSMIEKPDRVYEANMTPERWRQIEALYNAGVWARI